MLQSNTVYPCSTVFFGEIHKDGQPSSTKGCPSSVHALALAVPTPFLQLATMLNDGKSAECTVRAYAALSAALGSAHVTGEHPVKMYGSLAAPHLPTVAVPLYPSAQLADTENSFITSFSSNLESRFLKAGSQAVLQTKSLSISA